MDEKRDMPRIAAFDPGGVSASAALLLHGGEMDDFSTIFLDMVDLKTCPDGENRQIDGAALADILERWEPDVAVIENVQPMPSIPGPNGERRSMGAASSFRFGLGCGIIRGVVAAYQIPIVMCHPRSWKAHFGFKGSDKQMSIDLIKSRYPETAKFLTLKKHHGKADACCLAAYYAAKRGML